MPIKKKKISELDEAKDFTGFYTIGYRVMDGVKESAKIGLEYIQTAYEKVVQATKDAIAATTDVRQLETTVQGNEEARIAKETERNAAEQGRQGSEATRIASEYDRISTENTRVIAESERNTKETERIGAESGRVSAEDKRTESFSNMQQASEIATGAANAASASANQAAIAANQSADNADEKAQLAVQATENANDTANHPTYIGEDHYVYRWNKTTLAYDKTDIYTKGDAFSVKKVYASVIELKADTENSEVAVGDFVLVNTDDVENQDNARLYVKVRNEDATYSYGFLVDMSGAIGFTGKTPQFSMGIITTLEAGSSAIATVSENGIDSEGNPKYKINFAIPRGNPGAPFQVKGQYATIEELQTAIPDGDLIEGFIAVGDKVPYNYYAWVNGEWQNQGKIASEGGGKMVLIPSAVLFLTNTSTSNEILDAFGSKEAFIDVVTKVKEGAALAMDSNGAPVTLSMYAGDVVVEQNRYVLNFILINPADISSNFMITVTLTGEIATINNQDYPYGYANIVNIPDAVMGLTSNSTSDQVVSAFGGRGEFNKIVEKARSGRAVAIISTGSQSFGTSAFGVDYVDSDNLTLTIISTSYGALFRRGITVANGVFSCYGTEGLLLTGTELVSDTSVGGCDKPASAEAVKIVNDSMVTLNTEQRLTANKWFKENLKIDANSGEVYYYPPASGGWDRGLRIRNAQDTGTLGGFGAMVADNTLSYLYLGTAYNDTWMKVVPGGIINATNGFKGRNICIESDASGNAIGTCQSEINNFNSNLYLQHKSAHNVVMSMGGGRVGVGKIPTSYKFEVQGDILVDNWLRTFGDKGWYNETYGGGIYMTDSTYVRTYANKAMAAAGGFFKESDYRLKTNIAPLAHTLEQLLSIPTSSFVMNDKEQIGTIAQEIEQICPEMVSESLVLKSEVPEHEDWEVVVEKDSAGKEQEYVKVKRVEYEMTGILALEAVKLLKVEIDELKSEIKRLKGDG